MTWTDGICIEQMDAYTFIQYWESECVSVCVYDESHKRSVEWIERVNNYINTVLFSFETMKMKAS